jgi:hypothetical protein
MECKYCNKDKSLDDFPYYEARRWRICSICLKTYKAKYYQRDKEKILEQRKQYYKENREQILEYQKKYYKENKDKVHAKERSYRSRNKDKVSQWRKKYNDAHPEKSREWSSKRRARKRNVESEPWTHEEIAQAGTGFCPYCGKEIGLVYDSNIMEIDHMIPLARKGPNLKENLEPICCSCNAKKHTKTKEEFLQERL